MIESLADFSIIAKEKGPKRLAVLAPEDEEFMRAMKKSWQNGYIEPLLIGNAEKMKRIADKVEFDIDGFEKIFSDNRQAIADLGIKMLFSGELDIASKGQIPTSYIYRAIIKEEARAGSGMTVSVITLWEVPGLSHLVVLSDVGVNIKPDIQRKAEIIKNAVFVYNLLGYARPKIAVLSGQRKFGGRLTSYRDYGIISKAAVRGKFGNCEVITATSFTEIFSGQKNFPAGEKTAPLENMPHILIVPCLDTGNIICKLDALINVTRCSLVATSRGPVCIPARSDFSESIIQQMAMCAVIADRLKEKDKVR